MNERKWDEELVDRLTEMVKPESPNRAALSHLRRGIERPLDYTLGRVGWLFRRVPEFVALDGPVLGAGLFAWVKGNCPQADGVNFGKAFGAGLTLEEKQRREKRFIDLLDTDATELPYKLRQAVTLVAQNNVGLDWVRLIRHVGYWEDPHRWVQKNWARGFWADSEEESTPDQKQAIAD